MNLYPSFFNDMFGPIMLAGSSSHLAGPQRLGIVTNALTANKEIKTIEVLMDSEGSFAGTFGLMSENIGMLSGALGMTVDSFERNNCYEIAKEKNIKVVFTKGEMKESTHLNSMKFLITTSDNNIYTVVGDSIGGGMIQTKKIMGFNYIYKGEANLVMLVSKTDSYNIGIEKYLDIIKTDMSTAKNKTAFFIQVENEPDIDTLKKEYEEYDIYYIPCLLSNGLTKQIKPQLFKTGTEWVKLCKDSGKSMSDVAVEYQSNATGMTKEEIFDKMLYLSKLMKRQVECMENEDFGEYEHIYAYSTDMYSRLKDGQKKHSTLPTVTRNAVTNYFSVLSMAPGVLNVPGPHGAGGGVIMSSLKAAQDECGFSDEKLVEGLLVAAGYGVIAYDRTEPTGEVIGCAGEQGLAMVFATAALTHILGGTPKQVESSAAQSMQVSIGWPCDPVGGADGEPCLARGMCAVSMPFVFAELALSGIISPFPFHEMLDVVVDVSSKFDSSLLCTSKGGCAICPTALKLNKRSIGI